ncbi:lipocalin-like domain-containing protein [Novosphingobium bradum]|uniref:Lipocalin-like domain-containing protein n=1 Tax=Novosphingobium bradum TaxID=1737444 RepID=A0ABV7IRN1_9SPHN
MIDRARLLGSWKLVSAVVQKDGRDSDEQGFGPEPNGYIHYMPDGRMAALIAHTDQAAPPPGATDAERLAQAGNFVAYGGFFTLDGDTVTHHVDVSSSAAGMGLDYVRHLTLDGDRLEIRTPPAIPIGRAMSLVWQRVAPRT